MKMIPFLVLLAALLGGCAQSIGILEGATAACGSVHAEAFYTDTQADVVIAKAPDSWSSEEVERFCKGMLQ